MIVDAARWILFPTLMAFAASSDLLTMTISNRVQIILGVGFLALALAVGMPFMDILSHAGAGVTVLAVSFGFFVCGWIGGGDAKLAAASALWLGFDHLLAYLLYASLIGGGLTLLLLQFRMVPLPALLAGQTWLERLHQKGGDIPYGIALAAAALMVYPDTFWVKVIGS
jgi:prepilin peptidase CpaA